MSRCYISYTRRKMASGVITANAILTISYISKSAIPRKVCENLQINQLQSDPVVQRHVVENSYVLQKLFCKSIDNFSNLSFAHTRACGHVCVYVYVYAGLMHTCTTCRHSRHVRYPPSHFSQLTLGDSMSVLSPQTIPDGRSKLYEQRN